ncbi:MAG TPA: hypothetical protein VLN45_12685, partial [Ignavibacteriaceae bacterium]|nr:hypothetical protein [Ignavibacteriaceae bacterium]
LQRKIQGPAFFTVTANAALALYISGYSNDLKKCAQTAEESILSGEAFNKLVGLKNFTKNLNVA